MIALGLVNRQVSKNEELTTRSLQDLRSATLQALPLWLELDRGLGGPQQLHDTVNNRQSITIRR